jgi:hypothetical protein
VHVLSFSLFLSQVLKFIILSFMYSQFLSLDLINCNFFVSYNVVKFAFLVCEDVADERKSPVSEIIENDIWLLLFPSLTGSSRP